MRLTWEEKMLAMDLLGELPDGLRDEDITVFYAGEYDWMPPEEEDCA